MKPLPLAFLSALLLLGCGGADPAGSTENASESGSGSGSDSDDPTTGPADPTNDVPGCVPGTSIACSCTDGDQGAQVCEDDGKGYGPCECAGSSGTSGVDPSVGTSGEPMTTDPIDTSTGEPDTTTADPSASSSGEPDTTGGNACDGPDAEPNDDEETAVPLDEQGCNDEPQTLSGALAGADDVDWFTYHGTFGLGCPFGDPEAAHTLVAGDGVRLCVFATCDAGDAEFDCGGAQDETSPSDLPGCCDTGEVTFTLNCAGSMAEDATVLVRLDEGPPDACTAYEVEYSYQAAN